MEVGELRCDSFDRIAAEKMRTRAYYAVTFTIIRRFFYGYASIYYLKLLTARSFTLIANAIQRKRYVSDERCSTFWIFYTFL